MSIKKLKKNYIKWKYSNLFKEFPHFESHIEDLNIIQYFERDHNTNSPISVRFFYTSSRSIERKEKGQPFFLAFKDMDKSLFLKKKQVIISPHQKRPYSIPLYPNIFIKGSLSPDLFQKVYNKFSELYSYDHYFSCHMITYIEYNTIFYIVNPVLSPFIFISLVPPVDLNDRKKIRVNTIEPFDIFLYLDPDIYEYLNQEFKEDQQRRLEKRNQEQFKQDILNEVTSFIQKNLDITSSKLKKSFQEEFQKQEYNQKINNFKNEQKIKKLDEELTIIKSKKLPSFFNYLVGALKHIFVLFARFGWITSDSWIVCVLSNLLKKEISLKDLSEFNNNLYLLLPNSVRSTNEQDKLEDQIIKFIIPFIPKDYFISKKELFKLLKLNNNFQLKFSESTFNRAIDKLSTITRDNQKLF